MIKEPPKLQIRATIRRPSAEQVGAFKDIPTGFLCDAMGGQGALDASIQPIGGGLDLPTHAHGPALVADNGPAEILATMGALHIAEPGDIIVSAVHGHKNCSAAGDRFCGMMKNKGVAAFVTDGQMRDYPGIVAAGLPAWCAGLSPNSPYSNGPGKVGFGAVVGGRQVETGDIIVADRDGVVVVPYAQIDAVIAQLAAIQELEDTLDAKVQDGFCEMPAVEAMLADGTAKIVE
ncbi:4-hydroxy-4-methyl-2-oxoglutarate aldolase [Rhodobacteraceae bacterium THAF1]|uniref:RraA family protein n=1 Tax=Palleronia sp. THAF1 TaxID=2587842 RepID=UPI000F3B3A71|nr:RraA family protein [Palleronia sp. THAF1]QFU09666.1 4-hydroxy-4-methyl-2-oxoglutarate aldolase [Palleronia sp. THAF1]VDC17431.1 4-hydroxy-4-methyl-2-oxoglutarate aldolase [Rhodobacteraceae bacterium THAF1]